jgi:dolichol-phosphate mannosyltransferase
LPRTIIIIPTYNERECVELIIAAVRAAVPEATIQIVDDNSPDGTGAVADQIAARDPQVRVLHRTQKSGLGAAYIHAFTQALDEGWDRIVQMDADFSHNPADVPRLLQALEDGADMVVGSRYIAGGGTENWGLGRRIISRGGGFYARMALGVGVHDLTAGFKAWRAATLHGIDLGAVNARGYGFQIEMTYRTLRAGFQVREVPILFVDRRVGLSKMSGSIFFEAMTLVWRLRFRVAREKHSGVG